MSLREPRVSSLDGWRGLAILMVLLGHFTALHWLGKFGVELFFVLSGRLMASILLGQRQPLPTFAARRALRILPALLAFVALITAAQLVAYGYSDKLGRSVAGSTLFFTNYLVGGDVLTVFQHTWSLAVEEHSYIVLAGLVVLAGRDAPRASRWAFTLSVALMGFAATRWLTDGDGFIYLRSEARAASILLSFAIALRASVAVQRLPRLALEWAAPLTIGLSLAIVAIGSPPPVIFTVGTALLAIGVNLVEHSHRTVTRVFSDPVLRWFGLVSFSVYLWQQPFFEAWATGTSVFVALPLALLFGVASYYCVEIPSRRLMRGSRRPGDVLN